MKDHNGREMQAFIATNQRLNELIQRMIDLEKRIQNIETQIQEKQEK